MQARTSAQQTGVDVRLALKCLSTPMTCDSVTTHSKLMTGHETQSYQAVGRSAGPVLQRLSDSVSASNARRLATAYEPCACTPLAKPRRQLMFAKVQAATPKARH